MEGASVTAGTGAAGAEAGAGTDVRVGVGAGEGEGEGVTSLISETYSAGNHPTSSPHCPCHQPLSSLASTSIRAPSAKLSSPSSTAVYS